MGKTTGGASKFVPFLLAGAVAFVSGSCATPPSTAESVSCGGAPGSQARLSGATAVSPNDLWAVGIFQDRGPMQPLAEHWDGRLWSVAVTTSGMWTDAYLTAVSASGPSDVWAIGSGQATGVQERTLIEHWDGAAWQVVTSPNVGSEPNQLTAVTAISPKDAWTVGFYQASASLRTLTEHWDGATWSVVPGANPAQGINWLAAVSATSSSDVWAVGYRRESDAAMPQSLIEHWDGQRWTLVLGAGAGSVSSLTAVAALSQSDVWVAGTTGSGDTTAPLVEHWDGGRWTVVPSAPTSNVMVNAVGGRSSSDVWIGGEAGQGEGVHSLFEHWGGSRWTIVKPADGQTGVVNSMLPVAATSAWAIGSYRKTSCGPDWTLIQHWDGKAWHRVASPHDGS